MENKKEKDFLTYILLFLFIIFLILYFSNKSGYYEYKSHTRSELTKEAIKKFEKDLENGKDVTIQDYIIEQKDYTNFFSNMGYRIGTIVESIMNDGIKKTLKVVSALFYD